MVLSTKKITRDRKGTLYTKTSANQPIYSNPKCVHIKQRATICESKLYRTKTEINKSPIIGGTFINNSLNN